ncbi:MAG: hypothetical protein AAFP89_11285 [Bacteroidota bacterium]
MEDLFKKFLYTGVGLVAMTAEKLQETVDDLVGQGKVSKDEGKKIVNDFVEDVDNRRTDVESRVKEMVDKFTESVNLPRLIDQDQYEQLVSRLDAIEAKLGIDTPETPAAPVAEAAPEAPAVEEAKETPAPKKTTRRRKSSDA